MTCVIGRIVPSEIEITPEMIEAGTVAYLRRASHDEFSHYTPEEIVEAVLTSALQSAKKEKSEKRKERD